MNSKKKILITAGIGTAAVVAGVAPAIASATNTQSSSVTISDAVNPTIPGDQTDISNPGDSDNQTDPNNPVNPGDSDNQTDPNNPVNPGDQTDPNNPDEPNIPVDDPTSTYATAPDEDIFTLQIALYSTSDANLNRYFSNISYSNVINDYYYFHRNFQNSNQYSNVRISYVENSISNNTFEIKITPIGDAVWKSTKNNDQKIIKVTMGNSVSLPDATVPVKPRNGSFDAVIVDPTIKSNDDLNKWLVNYFEEYKISDFSVINEDYDYKNVTLSYVENSANVANKTFKVKATPIAGHSWSNVAFYNGTITDAFTLDVSFKNLDNSDRVFDSLVPVKVNNSGLNVFVEDPRIKTSADLNNWLNKYFATRYKLTDFVPQTPDDYNFQNVTLSYVQNSANLENKSFKVKAVPTAGHAWKTKDIYNDTIIDAVELNIWIGKMAIENLENLVNIPSTWSINWVINSDFDNGIYNWYFNFNAGKEYEPWGWPLDVLKWENISWFFTPGFDWYKSLNDKQYWKNLSVEYQRMMYEEAWKDLAKYYAVELAGDFSSVKWESVQRINQGIVFNFSVPLKPKAEHFWEDGSTDARYVPLKIFCSSKAEVGASVIGKTYNFKDIKNFNDIKSSDGIPDVWITNGLMKVDSVLTKSTFDENQKIIHDIVKADLEQTFPQYNIEITDIYSATPKYPYNYYGTWKYRILFGLKSDPTYLKTIEGYLFTVR